MKNIAFLFIMVSLWLFATPLSMGFNEKAIIVSDWCSASVLLVLSLCCYIRFHSILFFLLFFLGLWLELAPLIFLTVTPASFLNDTMIGIIVMVGSFSLISEQEQEKQFSSGLSYNPSSYSHRTVIVLLASICFLLARYLAFYELHYISTVFDPVFGKGTALVLNSKVSKSFPVPDAGLGSIAYLLEAIFCWQGGESRWKTMPWVVLTFGILAIPVGIVSIILIILQPLVVGAWCFICLLIALCMLCIVILSIKEVIATCQFLKKKRKKEGLWQAVWLGLNSNRDLRKKNK